MEIPTNSLLRCSYKDALKRGEAIASLSTLVNPTADKLPLFSVCVMDVLDILSLRSQHLGLLLQE